MILTPKKYDNYARHFYKEVQPPPPRQIVETLTTDIKSTIHIQIQSNNNYNLVIKIYIAQISCWNDQMRFTWIKKINIENDNNTKLKK